MNNQKHTPAFLIRLIYLVVLFGLPMTSLKAADTTTAKLTLAYGSPGGTNYNGSWSLDLNKYGVSRLESVSLRMFSLSVYYGGATNYDFGHAYNFGGNSYNCGNYTGYGQNASASSSVVAYGVTRDASGVWWAERIECAGRMNAIYYNQKLGASAVYLNTAVTCNKFPSSSYWNLSQIEVYADVAYIPNRPPSLSATVNGASVNNGESRTLQVANGNTINITLVASDPDNNYKNTRIQRDLNRSGNWVFDYESVQLNGSYSYTLSTVGTVRFRCISYDSAGAESPAIEIVVESQNRPPAVSISADKINLNAGDSTIIHVRATDADGNLHWINLDRIDLSNLNGIGYYGPGESFSADSMPNNGAWDIGADCAERTRDVRMTFSTPGIYRFRGAANDSSGWYYNAAASDLVINVGHNPTGSIQILDIGRNIIAPNESGRCPLPLNSRFYIRINGSDIDGNIARLYSRINKPNGEGYAYEEVAAAGANATYDFGPYTATQTGVWDVWGHVVDSTVKEYYEQGGGWCMMHSPDIEVYNRPPQISLSVNGVDAVGGETKTLTMSVRSDATIDILGSDPDSNLDRTRVWVNFNGTGCKLIHDDSAPSAQIIYRPEVVGTYEFHSRSIDSVGVESVTAIVNATVILTPPVANKPMGPERVYIDQPVTYTFSGNDPLNDLRSQETYAAEPGAPFGVNNNYWPNRQDFPASGGYVSNTRTFTFRASNKMIFKESEP